MTNDLPEMWGAARTAAELGTTTSNLAGVKGLPDPLYGPTHADPKRRLARGNLYSAAAIRLLAAERKARAGA